MTRLLIALVVLLSSAGGSNPALSQAPLSQLGAPIDINSATPEQLGQLLGIDANRAFAIVRARPYASKAQLVAKGVLPYAVYERIADKIVALPR